jgi:hypothetical protein
LVGSDFNVSRDRHILMQRPALCKV